MASLSDHGWVHHGDEDADAHPEGGEESKLHGGQVHLIKELG
eukprot:CAMPEP_0181235592 /NCGR_PEP_ID=MMETSP1096-20121128/37666_1 /TAXON_ID=156174 ORGANISM="Chrysochromulina ericina, Strain CCMP281" /NCGR_SAMPLE_ID=MMETSP1096 /ASSEMBLY_ACC=CAM_ASM_000453 /LENGTH=41 /DNA_ID= /DNA_START= /DNA_END= /DNA_ORIENTATION=